MGHKLLQRETAFFPLKESDIVPNPLSSEAVLLKRLGREELACRYAFENVVY